jgi:large subunit ribosomal protein L21
MEGRMYAIIETGGKQYRVSPGQSIEVDGLAETIGETVEIGDVLLLADDGEVIVGTPTVPGATVRATVTGQGRGPKLVVFKFRSGNRYRRKGGHRQGFTTLKIEDILRGGVGIRPAPPEAAKEPEPVAVAVEKPEPVAVAAPAAVAGGSIDELELPARVAGALKGAGLETVADLLARDEAELLAIRGFGAKSLEQLRASLRDKGLIE